MQGMHEQSQDPTVTQLRLGTWKFKEFAWIKDSFTLFGLQAETSERLCSQTLASAVIMSMTGDASNNVSSVISKEFEAPFSGRDIARRRGTTHREEITSFRDGWLLNFTLNEWKTIVDVVLDPHAIRLPICCVHIPTFSTIIFFTFFH